MTNDAAEMTEPIRRALDRVKRCTESQEDRDAIAAFGRECFAAGYDAGVKDALEGIRLAARREL